MSHRFPRLCLIAVALVASVTVQMSAETRRRHVPGNVEILVNGVAQPRFEHNGRLYVEALKGREYAIRLRNPFPVRVAVALSVDGLNTIDARETSAASARKWVLGPYQIVTISGWQTSQREARRFEFTTEERSYGQALGKTANLGVISAVFFKERVVERSRDTSEYGDARAGARQAPASPNPQAAPAQEQSAAAGKSRSDEDYAATGMGRRTDHVVTRVWLDLEDRPAQSVDIRYEFRPQLVRLGILPRTYANDPLDRREGARGFDDTFAPVPPGLRQYVGYRAASE